MEKRFIAYYLDAFTPNKTVPIATGRTHQEAEAMGITRILICGIVDGCIQVQDRTEDVNEEGFTKLTELLNSHFEATDVKLGA